MKKVLYIFLTLLSVQVSAQIEQPRVKLNQIIKDTMAGRFLMSSFVDSNMTYESLLATDGNLLYFKNQPYVSGGVNSIEYLFEASSNISQGQAVAINVDGKVSSVVTSGRTLITDSDLDLFMLSKNLPNTASHIINLDATYKYNSLDWANKMLNISGRLGIVARNPDTTGYLNILDFDGVLESSNFITSSLKKDEFTQYGLVSYENERNISIIPIDTINNPSTSYTNNKWLAYYKNDAGRNLTQLNKNSSNGWPAFSGTEYPILQYQIINGSPALIVTMFPTGGFSFYTIFPTYHTNIHKLNGNKLIATLFESNQVTIYESVRVVQGTIVSNTVSDSIHWDSYFVYSNESAPYLDIENINPKRGHSVYVPDENKVTIVSVVETGSLVDTVANIVATTVYIESDTLVQTELDTLLPIYSFNDLDINVTSFKDKVVVVKSTVGNPALAEYFQDFYVFTLNNGVLTAPVNYTRVGPYTVPNNDVIMVYDHQIDKLIVGINTELFAGTYNSTTGTLIFGPKTYTDYNIDEITFNYNKDSSDYTRIAVLHEDEKKVGLYDVSVSNIYNFIGFSKDSIPAGSLGTVTLLGGVNEYQDSLSPGRSYYVNTEGNLQLDYTISGVVGKALTDTSILVTYIGTGNPYYVDEDINIVDINPIINISTNEATPLTVTRTTNTTTLDITEATTTTDGYITSEYKIQLDNLLSNSYIDTIITDNTLLYTELSKDTVTLKVDTSVIATVSSITDSLDNRGFLTTEVDGSVTNEIQDISTNGTSGNITISSGSTITLNVDDADASATNEGSLTVAAGGANDSEIQSNTSGSSNVVIAGGSNVTVTESGQTITIASTGGGAIPVDTFVTIAGTETITGAKTFTANTVFDDSTLVVDATNNNVGIGTASPSAKFQVDADSAIAVDATNNRLHINGTYDFSFLPSARGKIEINGTENSAAFRYKGGFINETNDFASVSKSTASLNKRVQYIFYDRNNVQTGKFGVDVAGADDDDFQIVAGSGSTPQFHLEANGNVGIGTTSPTTALEVNGTITGTTFVETSSIRYKTNVEDIIDTEMLNLFRPVTYTLKQNNSNDLGFIAEEVYDVYKDLVVLNDEGKPESIKYTKFIPLIIKRLQEQDIIIKNLENKIKELENK